MPKQEVKFLLHGQHPEVQPAVPEFIIFPARPQFSVTEGTLKSSIYICSWKLCQCLSLLHSCQWDFLNFAVLSGCGGELSGPSGSFHSPGYPNRYPSNRECIWYIHTAPGSSIQLTIYELDVAYHPNCSYDVLEVRAKIHKLHGFLSGVDNRKNCRSRTNNSTAISHFCCSYSSVPQRLSQKP